MEDDTTIEGKVVVLGSQGVGKTSLVLWCVNERFEETRPTIGAAFLTKKMTIGDRKIKMQIWDTAGQERFRSMAPMYYRGAESVILVFDMTNRQSFEDLKSWVEELRSNCTTPYFMHVVAAKKDLAASRQVSTARGEEFAREHNARYFEVSAKEGDGTTALFLDICKMFIERQRQQKEGATASVSLNPTPNTNNGQSEGCC